MVRIRQSNKTTCCWIETPTRQTRRLDWDINTSQHSPPTECKNISDNGSPSHTTHPELSLPSSTQGTSSSDSGKRVAHGQRKHDDAYNQTHQHRRRKITMRCRCQASTHPTWDNFDSSPMSLNLCPTPSRCTTLRNNPVHEEGDSSSVIVAEP
jgi:hypothetical protein